jgi:hypothetical protein
MDEKIQQAARQALDTITLALDGLNAIQRLLDATRTTIKTKLDATRLR